MTTAPPPVNPGAPASARGETAAAPAQRRRSRRRFRASQAKDWVVTPLYRLAGIAPEPSVRLLVRCLTGVVRAAYAAPGNALREGCEAIAAIARARGIAHEPRAIYDRFLDQAGAIGAGFLEVYHRGPAAAVRRTDATPFDTERIRRLVAEHGGVCLCTSHNVGAVFCSMWLHSVVPCVVVAKNQRMPRLEAVARDCFRRMQVEAALVRDMSPVAVSRACLAALRQRKVVVATMDLIHRKPDRLPVTMFGQEVGLAPWAFRFAAKRQVPVLPVYVAVDDGIVRPHFGEPLVTRSIEEGAAWFARFMEAHVLEDPGSWAFLGDKRWRVVLRAARAAAAAAG